MQLLVVFLVTSLLPSASSWFGFTHSYAYSALLSRSVVLRPIAVNTQLDLCLCTTICVGSSPTQANPTDNSPTSCRLLVFTSNATGLYCTALGPSGTNSCQNDVDCIPFPESELLSDYMFLMNNHDNCALWQQMNGTYPGYG